jgi:hypothetical protein
VLTLRVPVGRAEFSSALVRLSVRTSRGRVMYTRTYYRCGV